MGALAQSTRPVARISGVLIRSATWGDLEEVADLLGSQSRAVSGIGVRVAQLRAEWDRAGFVVGQDNLVAVDDGEVTGYGVVKPGGELVLAALDEPTADELFERLCGRARQRGHATLIAVVESGEGELATLVHRRAFRLDREILLMWRPLGGPVEEPRVPEGITVRTFERDDAEAVHSLLNDAYTSWDDRYVPLAHDEWVNWMTGDPEFDPSVWWLAERDGTLVGCALHWSSGWLKDLAVASQERGRGLGEVLVRHGLFEFATWGIPRVGLKVDAANPTGAVRLYERLGFVVSSREATWTLAL